MKSKLSRPQFLVIILAVLVVVLILLLPRVPENKSTDLSLPSEVADVPAEKRMEEFTAGLSPERKEKINALEEQLLSAASKAEKLQWYDSLVLYARVFENPELEAEYLKKYAELSDAVNSWFAAGDAYFNNFRNSEDKVKKYMISQAVGSYQQILRIEPENLKALNALGVSYVEGAAHLGEPPMKGIGMIREVLQKDPQNIDALVNLGYFAIQSGQYEKAIERYRQVLEIDSSHIEAYLYLTDIYVTLGEKDKAVESLEKYKSYVEDQEKRTQIDHYIEEIKKSN